MKGTASAFALLLATTVTQWACSSKSTTGTGDAGLTGVGTLSPCDPFAPSPKPISLGRVVAAGRSAIGTIYAIDETTNHENRVFVSNDGVLERQRIAGSGTSPAFYVFTIEDHTPPFTVQADMAQNVPTAMGVLEGPLPNGQKTIVIGQDGEKLTLLSPADLASMPVRNLPGAQVLEYNARLDDGRAMVVVRPKDDWTFMDFRVFFGEPPALTERQVTSVSRDNDTWIVFDLDGAQATVLFRWILMPDASAPGQAALTVGGVTLPLTQLPGTAPPDRTTYSCFTHGQ